MFVNAETISEFHINKVDGGYQLRALLHQKQVVVLNAARGRPRCWKRLNTLINYIEKIERTKRPIYIDR